MTQPVSNTPMPQITYPLYTDQPILSDSWRINTSQIQVIELANCLRALNKIIGTISNDTLGVSFNTQEDQSFYNDTEKIIRIDPRFALQSQKFPIPPHDFDVLVAHGIHEAFHNQTGSEVVREGLKRSSYHGTQGVNLRAKETANKIAIVGEEIYVDNAARRKSDLLYKYIYKARLAYRGNVADKHPDWSDPVTAWSATGMYGIIPPDGIPSRILDCLAIFNVLQQTLAGWELTPLQRVEYYNKAAQDINNIMQRAEIEDRLKGTTSPPRNPENPQTPKDLGQESPPDKSQGVGTPEEEDEEEDNGGNKEKDDGEEKEDEEEDNNEDGEKSGEESDKSGTGNSPQLIDNSITTSTQNLSLTPLHGETHISTQLQHDIEEALQSEMEDISQEIRDEYNEFDPKLISQSRHGDAQIIWSKSKNPIDPTFDEQLARELIWLRQLKNKIGHQTFRSERHGKLDPTRLHKIQDSDDVFKLRKQRDRQTLDLVCVVDASGSMNGKGEAIYEAVKALRHSLPDTTVISYEGGLSGIHIEVQSIKKSPMTQIQPCGETPSGPAILAAIKRFPKSLLIHFSDGGANVGPDLDDTFALIEKNYPDTRIINVEYPTRRTFAPHANVQTIALKTISAFPTLIKEVLKAWQMSL